MSYGSVLGVLAIFTLVVVVIFDGATTSESPGSLYNVAETTIFYPDAFVFPMVIGLLYEGFGCHTVLPCVIREMKYPKSYFTMMKWCFAFAVAFNILWGSIGYLIFGSETLENVGALTLRRYL